MLRSALIVSVACASSCGDAQAPALALSDVTVTRPLPGTEMSAGYFSARNDSGLDLVITSIGSPQFQRVEMHETVIEDDVSRMQRLDVLRIAPRQRVRFEPGGKHLMLMHPTANPDAVDSVTLHFYSGENLLLSVRTTPADP